ncbi:Hypothetical predicted protein, partial [Podarcis lilfordi]
FNYTDLCRQAVTICRDLSTAKISLPISQKFSSSAKPGFETRSKEQLGPQGQLASPPLSRLLPAVPLRRPIGFCSDITQQPGLQSQGTLSDKNMHLSFFSERLGKASSQQATEHLPPAAEDQTTPGSTSSPELLSCPTQSNLSREGSHQRLGEQIVVQATTLGSLQENIKIHQTLKASLNRAAFRCLLKVWRHYREGPLPGSLEFGFSQYTGPGPFRALKSKKQIKAPQFKSPKYNGVNWESGSPASHLQPESRGEEPSRDLNLTHKISFICRDISVRLGRKGGKRWRGHASLLRVLFTIRLCSFGVESATFVFMCEWVSVYWSLQCLAMMFLAAESRTNLVSKP